MTQYADWQCNDCTYDCMDEYYTVNDFIWEKAGVEGGMLCVGCLEVRMGRRLMPGDFPHWLINVWNYGVKSDRLIDRLTGGMV